MKLQILLSLFCIGLVRKNEYNINIDKMSAVMNLTTTSRVKASTMTLTTKRVNLFSLCDEDNHYISAI